VSARQDEKRNAHRSGQPTRLYRQPRGLHRLRALRKA
jgi:hypothetical protein